MIAAPGALDREDFRKRRRADAEVATHVSPRKALMSPSQSALAASPAWNERYHSIVRLMASPRAQRGATPSAAFALAISSERSPASCGVEGFASNSTRASG